MPKTTHGKWKSKEWNSWDHMKRRCNNPKDPKYADYGGRGIKVCESWMKFENFYKDMGDAPSPKHSLDRKRFNGNYEKKNCKWSTGKEQSNNKRNNRTIIYNGDVKTLAQWADAYGMSRGKLIGRLFIQNLDFERAVAS